MKNKMTTEEKRIARNNKQREYIAKLPEDQKLWLLFYGYMYTALKKRFATSEELEAIKQNVSQRNKRYYNSPKGKERNHPSTPKGWAHYAYSHFKTSHNQLIKNGRIPSDSKYDLTPKSIFNCLKKQNFRCEETGIKFTFGTPDCPNKPSYDRINNDEGYQNKNLRLVTAQTNVSRNALSVKDHFLRQVLVVERIKRNNPEKYKMLLSEIKSKYEYALI